MGPSFYLEDLSNNTVKNLQVDFSELRMKSVTGIYDVGDVKNLVTEDYAESSELRVYIPTKITNKSTNITLEIAFLGKNASKSFDDFRAFIQGKMLSYWDSYRNKKVPKMILNKKLKKIKDTRRGDSTIIIYQFNFLNVSGKIIDV